MKPFTQDIPGLNGVKFDLVPIPGGKFKMGSPDAEKKRGKDEGPQVEIEVEPFYMGKHEVTWDVFNEFLNRYNLLGQNNKAAPVTVEKQADAVSYPTPIYDIDAGPALQRMGGREGKLPASIMSHFAAKQFTKWLSAKTGRFYRLPTEAEWEYAARGGKDSAYSFGADAKELEEHAWFVDNSELPDGDPGYRKVGMKKPNGFGLYDMHGNVAEIVIDQYDPEWYKSLAGKGGTVSWRDAVRWPDAMYPRVVRGGGYESEAEELRSSARKKITVAFNTRDPQSPKSPYWWTEGFTVGFRLVSPVKEPTAEEKAKFWEPDNDSLKEILKRDREIREMIQDVKPKQAAAPAGGATSAVQTAKSEK
jgi:formylglycine-generating enzyme required for sulfatase activity